MTDPIAQQGLSPKFWEKKRLSQMNEAEWEALCDGCGKCCLNKLEDEDSGEVALTRVACRLLDDATCRCAHYDTRHQFIPDCIVLKPANIESQLYWMPQTCASRLIYEGKPLFEWHRLISGSAETVHMAGVSMQDRTVSEFDVADDDWEDHIIDEPL